jgi:hypothetical protein
VIEARRRETTGRMHGVGIGASLGESDIVKKKRGES